MTDDGLIHPVYVDGPLKGQGFAVNRSCRHVQAIDYDRADYGCAPIVTYRLNRFVLRSGNSAVALWLACSELREPSAEVLADLLLSDAAKAAMTGPAVEP